MRTPHSRKKWVISLARSKTKMVLSIIKIRKTHYYNSHVFREFFNGLKGKVVFISFLTYPENIVTVDAGGYIYYWEYDNAYFELKGR